MLNQEKQSSWGILIGLYVFLAGMGGGLFLFSAIFNLFHMYESIARIGALVGPLCVGAGAALLLLDLGSIKNAYRLFTKPATMITSWMSRGAWLLMIFMGLALAYALPAFAPFSWLPWSQGSVFGQILGIVAAVFGLLVVVYPGFLFGVLKSVPFWNAGVLPLLFFISGLDMGLAALALIGVLQSAGAEALHLMGAGDIILIVLLLIVLAAYLEVVRSGGLAAHESLHLLKTPLFILGAVTFGMLIPLALLAVSYFIADVSTVRLLALIIGVLIILGGLSLRYSIIKAGVMAGVALER